MHVKAIRHARRHDRCCRLTLASSISLPDAELDHEQELLHRLQQYLELREPAELLDWLRQQDMAMLC